MWESDRHSKKRLSGGRKESRLQKWTSHPDVSVLPDNDDVNDLQRRPPADGERQQHAVSLGDLPLLLAADDKKPPRPPKPPRRQGSAPLITEYHDDKLVDTEEDDAAKPVGVVRYVVEMPVDDADVLGALMLMAGQGGFNEADLDADYGWEEDDEEMVITEVKAVAPSIVKI